MEKRTQLKLRCPTPFAWIMILLCLVLALGLCILIYGLCHPAGVTAIQL